MAYGILDRSQPMSGYLTGRKLAMAEDQNQMAQMQGILGIQGALQQQQDRQRAIADQERLRSMLMQSPEVQNNPALMAAAQANPGAVLPYLLPKKRENVVVPRGGALVGNDGTPIFQQPDAPKAPTVRKLIQGDVEIHQELQPDMTWKEVGRGPRFARQVAPIVNVGGGGSRGGEKENKAPAGFRWTANGDLERIPGGPADLKANADLEKKAAGAGDVDIALGSLRDAYNRLESGGGITSTKNSALGNITASASSSALGQVAGRALGTNNQSARNDIAMARPALLAALMKATGMNAKQMDSNAELKLWLSTATDPTLDVEANRRALDNIERKYLSGAAPKPAAATGGWSVER